MYRARNCRRSFLLSGLSVAGGLFLAGCGESQKEGSLKVEEDPTDKAKESMDFYKNTYLKKGGRKKAAPR